MSIGAMKLIIVILVGILVVSAVYEMTRRWLQHIEDKREQERIDHWRKKRMW